MFISRRQTRKPQDVYFGLRRCAEAASKRKDRGGVSFGTKNGMLGGFAANSRPLQTPMSLADCTWLCCLTDLRSGRAAVAFV